MAGGDGDGGWDIDGLIGLPQSSNRKHSWAWHVGHMNAEDPTVSQWKSRFESLLGYGIVGDKGLRRWSDDRNEDAEKIRESFDRRC